MFTRHADEGGISKINVCETLRFAQSDNPKTINNKKYYAQNNQIRTHPALPSQN